MGRRKMDAKVKSSWTVFIFGFVAVVFAAAMFEMSNASSKEGAPRENNPESSTIKAKIPMSKEMSRKLNMREQELDERQKALTEFETRLKVENERVQAEILRLSGIKSSLEKSQKANQKISDEVKEKLVKTFEKMTPKKSAPIISNMEDEMAVELLVSMKEKSIAAVLEKMDADRAMLLSTMIAGRKPALQSGNLEGKSQP